MKIMLSASSFEPNAPVDPRFGRAAYLLLVDSETQQMEAFPNRGANASGGAGTQAAQFVAAQHADVAISGDFGPNAFEALQAAGVAMYLYGETRTVQEAMTQFKAGQLKQVGEPTSTGRHA